MEGARCLVEELSALLKGLLEMDIELLGQLDNRPLALDGCNGDFTLRVGVGIRRGYFTIASPAALIKSP